MQRDIFGQWFAAANHGSAFGNGRDIAAGQELHQNIPQHRRLHRTCRYGHAAAVGGHLQKQPVFGAAADHIKLIVPLAGAVLNPLQGAAVFQRQAFVYTAHGFACRLGNRLTGFFDKKRQWRRANLPARQTRARPGR